MESKPGFESRINYQAPGREGGGGLMRSREEEEFLRGEERAYYYADPGFVSMLRDLKTQARPDQEVPRAEKERSKERLETDWTKLGDSELNELQDLLDYQLLRLKSPYPYDSRKPAQWFEGLKDGIRRAYREDWGDEENPNDPVPKLAKAWINRAAVDSSWGEANFRLQEGLGTVLPNFYDGKKMMQWVSMPMRSDPVASFYLLNFATEPPGLKLSEEQKALLPEQTKRAIKEGVGVKEGLRERAIRYQDDNAFWKMAVASVNQIDFQDSTRPSLIERMSPAEIAFIRRVFVDHDPEADSARWAKLEEKVREEEPQRAEEILQRARSLKENGGWVYYTPDEKHPETRVLVPSFLLNWYSMDSVEEKKERYLATMEVLLMEGTLAKLSTLTKPMPDGSEGVDEQALTAMVNDIRQKVQQRLDNWFSYEGTLDQKLASVVTRFGIVMDWTHMSSAEMSWGWNYDLSFDDKKREVVVKRSQSLGGTTTAMDSSTPGLWRETEMANQRKVWTKGMLPPMSEEFRNALRAHAVDWKPDFFEWLKTHEDPLLQKAWDKLWADEPGWKWDPKLKAFLQHMVWYWETPYVGADGKTKLVLPIFLPPEVASLNFWNTISFKDDCNVHLRAVKDENGNYVIKKGAESVWQQLRRRVKMSVLNWKRMGDQALYRWMITMGQTVRYIVTMLDPKSVVEDQFEAFYEDPEKIVEQLKRSDLGERDEQLPMTALTMSIVPMATVLSSASKHGIIGPAGEDIGRRSLWAEQLSKWIAVFKRLPSERDGYSGYGVGMAKLTRFYAAVFARLGRYAGTKEHKEAQNIYKKEMTKDFEELEAAIEGLRVVDEKPDLKRVEQ